MRTCRVRDGDNQVDAVQSLNLSSLGKKVGATPGRTDTHHRWKVAVAELPAALQQKVIDHPLLRGSEHLTVDPPKGENDVVSLPTFMNYVEGGVVPEGLRPFLKPGREVREGERTLVVRLAARAGFGGLASHIARGGNGYDFATACKASPEACAKLTGGAPIRFAPKLNPYQRGRAVASLLAARMKQA